MKETKSEKCKTVRYRCFVYRETIGAFFFCLLAGGFRHSGEAQWRAYTRDLGKGQKAGKRLKIINECLIHSKKTDWKFENGILYHCSKDKSIGGRVSEMAFHSGNTVKKQGRACCLSGKRVGNRKRTAKMKKVY